MKKRCIFKLFVPLVSVGFLGAGCLQTPEPLSLPTAPIQEPAAPQAVPPSPQAEGQAAPSPVNASQEPAAPTPKPTAPAAPRPAAARAPYYIAFTKAQYEKARAEGRPVLLYFYANWCPICRVEEPMVKADVEKSVVPVAGFRVNFKDSDTDTDEKALAEELGITYQHTTVVFDTKGNEVDRFFGPVESAERNAALQKASR